MVITDQEQCGLDLSQDLLITIIEFSLTRMLRLVTHFRTHSSVSDDDVSEFCQFSHESLISGHLVMVRGKIILNFSIFAAERDRYNTL